MFSHKFRGKSGRLDRNVTRSYFLSGAPERAFMKLWEWSQRFKGNSRKMKMVELCNVCWEKMQSVHRAIPRADMCAAAYMSQRWGCPSTLECASYQCLLQMLTMELQHDTFSSGFDHAMVWFLSISCSSILECRCLPCTIVSWKCLTLLLIFMRTHS